MNHDENPAVKAIDERNALLNAFLDSPDEEFERTIRIALQESARSQSAAADMPGNQAYWTGYLSGYADALAALFRERLRQKAIQSAVDGSIENNPVIEHALRYLYERKISRPHPEMASLLETTYDHLTETMKPLLAVDAVQASRTGRDTRYDLTPAGRRFCRDVLTAGDGKEA